MLQYRTGSLDEMPSVKFGKRNHKGHGPGIKDPNRIVICARVVEPMEFIRAIVLGMVPVDTVKTNLVKLNAWARAKNLPNGRMYGLEIRRVKGGLLKSEARHG